MNTTLTRHARIPAFVAVAAALVAAVAGCAAPASSAPAVATDAALPTTVPKGTVLTLADQGQGLKTALEVSGELDKIDYDLEIGQFEGMPAVLEALRTGAADVGTGGDISVSVARAQGEDIVAIGVIRSSKNYYGFYTAPGNGDIISAAQLKGKKIAYADATQLGLYTLRVLDKVGLTTDDVELVRLTIPDIPNALRTGQVDAAAIYEPNRTNYERDYGDQGLHTLPEGEDAGTGLGYLYATREALNDPAKLAALRELVASYTKAHLWKNSHSDEWAQSYFVDLQKLDPEVADQIVASQGEISIPRLDDDLVAEQQTYIDFLVAAGELPGPQDAAEEYDFRFDEVQLAAAESVE